MSAPHRRLRPPAHLLVWSIALGGCPGGSPILWPDMNAPRDVPAPDLQVALGIVGADAGDVPGARDAPDASDVVVRDAR